MEHPNLDQIETSALLGRPTPRHSRKKLQKKETSAPIPKKHLEYEVSQGRVVRENTLPVRPPNVTQISIFDCPHR